MHDTEDRITELEIRLAWQDDLLDNLNQALIRQQQQLDLMQQQLRRLYDMTTQQGQAESGSLLAQLQQEIPPHY
ncbi:SlyX family protein [Rivihabitans pingtungensis]|jgi:SlyX protein|uniref:Protein SlyX homolog n=1 Tax=Rivihabitans pingtungensis TaxID=1054498 RepID=A0A318KR29_9NEIS|nr:SlyX family protein [Rivihabitans pingtungensis]MCK6437193.1 SlyX family protein [Rivihabitans pingtungensis]PXX80281.1 SlyX protein [Rivihabitans pingtungensis]